MLSVTCLLRLSFLCELFLGGIYIYKVKAELSVFYENPFWVGVFERFQNEKPEVCRVVFGSEPKDYEVYEIFLKYWHKLKFSPPVADTLPTERKINPKRMQRAISEKLEQNGVGTKSQQALKIQQEANKLERKAQRKKKSEEDAKRKFELHRQKKKVKLKGR